MKDEIITSIEKLFNTIEMNKVKYDLILASLYIGHLYNIDYELYLYYKNKIKKYI